jgi:hypothetical protein
MERAATQRHGHVPGMHGTGATGRPASPARVGADRAPVTSPWTSVRISAAVVNRRGKAGFVPSFAGMM